MRHPRRPMRLCALMLMIAAAGAVGAAAGAPTQSAPASTAMESLVTTEWLSAHLGEPDLVVLDCTVRVERDQEGTRGRSDSIDIFLRKSFPKMAYRAITSRTEDWRHCRECLTWHGKYWLDMTFENCRIPSLAPGLLAQG